MAALEKKTKAELISIIKDLTKKLEIVEKDIAKVERDFKTFKALKSGIIGINAKRNPKA